MTGRDVKHCGTLTDHDPHDWRGRGQSTVMTSSADLDPWQIEPWVQIGPDYWCKGTIVVEGGHW